MTNEYRVFGPPGVGKTTWTAKNIGNAVEKYGKDRVLVSSFTRAAAAEISSRDIDVKHGMAGTLHSICWHALGQPTIAETGVDAFNQDHPTYKVTETHADLDELTDPGDGKSYGDGLLQQYQLLRARMVPREGWPMMVRHFATAWEGWKNECGVLDFNDLIEQAMLKVYTPNNAAVGFIDEAQDLSTLQFALVRKWANRMESVIFIGDDDQSIYGFAGADPGNLIADNLPADRVRVLSESYRLPEMVYRFAVAWIERCQRRQAKDFRPRPAQGAVVRNTATWRDPRRIVDSIEEGFARTDQEISPSAMILGSCSYMLQPVIMELKARGIPFHNPYRRNRGDWNPLSRATGSIQNRVRAFWYGAKAHPPVWTALQMKLWIELVRADGVLKRGVKSFILDLAKDHPAALLDVNEYHNFFEGGCPFEYDRATLDWLGTNALESKRRQIRYPIDIIKKHGVDAFEQPRVIVGTIHSVKGGQADHVYILPDLSTEAATQWDRGGEGRDSIRRTFYVGMTRTFEKLIVCEPATGLAVKLGSI